MRTLLLFTLLAFVNCAFANYSWISPWGEPETEPSIELVYSGIDGFKAEITVSGFYIDNIITEQGEFSRIRLWDPVEAVTMDIGSPELPVIRKLIDIPSTAEANIKIDKDEFIDLSGYRIYPFQKPLKDGEIAAGFDFNGSAYTSSSLFPLKLGELEGTGVMRQIQVGNLRISPVQYKASTGQLRLHRKIEVEVSFVSGKTPAFDAPSTKITPYFDNLYSKRALNYKKEFHTSDYTDEVVGTRYLVICPEDAIDIIQPLIDLRNAQGLRVEVMTITPDFRTPQAFKAAITERYLSDGLEYVLLIGDPSTSNNVLPMYYWTYDPQNLSYSDSWYTCVVPGGDSDHLPELAIGRYVYFNLSELNLQIQKTMNYLTGYDESEDWFQRSLLVAHGEQYPLKYTQCKEEVRNYNYSQQIPLFSTIYGGAGGSNIDIVNYVNNTSCGLLNYRGHGSETNWPQWSGYSSFTVTQINAMTNMNRLFILFDVCCSNGNAVNYSSNTLSENFMKANFAAAAIHAAINPSYTDPNHIFDKEFYKAIYDDGITNLGYASNSSAVDVNTQWGIYGQANFRMYFWQGDAAIDLWTHTPAYVEVTTPQIIPFGIDQIDITVSVSGTGIEGAAVCFSNDEVYAVGYTDVTGTAIVEFDPLPLTQGDIYLTVSGHNLKFYQDTLIVDGEVGTLEGFVRSNQTQEPLIGAGVSIPYLNYETITDSSGFYTFENIPALTYDVTAQYEGYIDSTVNVVVTGNLITSLDFNLLHPECVPGVQELSAVIEQGETIDVPFTVSNPGDYPLTYTVLITGEEAGASMAERINFSASEPTADYSINGITYDGEIFWVAGSGDSLTNYLHKFNSDGVYIESIPQPNSTTSTGFYDICWDGEYLYGADEAGGIASSINKFDTNGNFISSFNVNTSPVKAMTCDANGVYFYVCNGVNNFWKTDTTGSVLRIYSFSLNITGLAWREDDPDGYNVYILSNGPPFTVSKMKPSNGQTMFVAEIENTEGLNSGGCWIVDEYDPQYLLMTGVVQGEDEDVIKGWQIDQYFDWISISPDSGIIPGGESQSFTGTFDGMEFLSGSYEAILSISHNALGETSEIPVYLTLNPSGVIDHGLSNSVPKRFMLHQNQPNPFNGETAFKFETAEMSEVIFSIYDILGRKVSEVDLGVLQPGIYTYNFKDEQLSSGIYFCQMEAGKYASVKKIVLLK